jgi:indolepyruvate ferredoxin oxidoreductase beta subunit
MRKKGLPKDPYNIIITGVGGQGNVMASKVLSRMLIRQGYSITIGETFGASQRGGSVMSHIRVSGKSTWSPQVPRGRVDFVAAIEPIEAIRILTT